MENKKVIIPELGNFIKITHFYLSEIFFYNSKSPSYLLILASSVDEASRKHSDYINSTEHPEYNVEHIKRIERYIKTNYIGFLQGTIYNKKYYNVNSKYIVCDTSLKSAYNTINDYLHEDEIKSITEIENIYNVLL